MSTDLQNELKLCIFVESLQRRFISITSANEIFSNEKVIVIILFTEVNIKVMKMYLIREIVPVGEVS